MSLFSASFRKIDKLRQEVRLIQDYLDAFESPANGERRTASISQSGECIVVRNFPLPDRYRPDYIDLLLITDDYPARPPIGLYVLNKRNEALIRQIESRFNAFRDHAHHNADPIKGYTWICYTYAGNSWHYCEANLARGDNVRKYLASCFAELNT